MSKSKKKSRKWIWIVIIFIIILGIFTGVKIKAYYDNKKIQNILDTIEISDEKKRKN